MRFMGAFTREEFEKLNDSDFENGDMVIVKDITKKGETVSYYMYSKASDNYIIIESYVVDKLKKELGEEENEPN